MDNKGLLREEQFIEGPIEGLGESLSRKGCNYYSIDHRRQRLLFGVGLDSLISLRTDTDWFNPQNGEFCSLAKNDLGENIWLERMHPYKYYPVSYNEGPHTNKYGQWRVDGSRDGRRPYSE